MAIARTRRDHLQRILGDRGTVEEFVAITDLTHRGVGWYVTPLIALDGCECEFCEAAREERTIFLATGSYLAATLLHTYSTEHPGSVVEASG